MCAPRHRLPWWKDHLLSLLYTLSFCKRTENIHRRTWSAQVRRMLASHAKIWNNVPRWFHILNIHHSMLFTEQSSSRTRRRKRRGRTWINNQWESEEATKWYRAIVMFFLFVSFVAVVVDVEVVLGFVLCRFTFWGFCCGWVELIDIFLSTPRYIQTQIYSPNLINHFILSPHFNRLFAVILRSFRYNFVYRSSFSFFNRRVLFYISSFFPSSSSSTPIWFGFV